MPFPVLRNFSIKRKLVWITLLTILTVSGLAGGALLWFEILSSRQSTVRSLSTITDLVAQNSAAALMFDDRKFAREIMAGLRAEPEILHAGLYDTAGKLVATYPLSATPEAFPARQPDGEKLGDGAVKIFHPILDEDNKRVGTVYIEGTLAGTYRRLEIYGLVLGCVLAMSFFVAFMISTWLQRLITAPLLNLANAAGIVSSERNYSVRAVKISDDELGQLTDAFNSMLNQIELGHSALLESEERFRTLADNMAQLAWMADESGRASWYNKRWYDYVGGSASDAASQGWDMIHPEHFERVQAHFWKCIESGAVWEDTFPLRGADGQYRWFLSRAAPIKSPDGHVQRWFGTATDVTEQRLAEEQITRARDAAVRAARTKDNFLAALSHELRTPLNPVLLLASDAAENNAFPAEAREHFETIRKNVQLEARLIDDLLDLTRITQGKLRLDRVPVDLDSVLQDAFAIVEPDFAAKSIVCSVSLDPTRPQVLADPIRLQQVIWNVLKNAAKFTPAGGRVSVITSVAGAASEVSIDVTDTGIGLTPEETGRIFEAFSQGDHAASTSTHRFGGLGLGLAITRSVVELHGGRIVATSPGRDLGTTFSITLPLSFMARPQGRTGGSSSGELVAREAPPGLRVLLVEDHVPTRNAILHLLKRRSHDVVPAGSLAEAREAFRLGGFQLLISDIGLPDGTGNELMREVRAVSDIPGIALTGYGMEEDVKNTYEAGFVVHLTKPVQIAALDEAIARVTGAAAARK